MTTEAIASRTTSIHTCTAQRHGNLTAYNKFRCRCPSARQAAAVAKRRRHTYTGNRHTTRRSDPHCIDLVAVNRACKGDKVDLTLQERTTAVHQLTTAGLNMTEIGALLRVDPRTVLRHRRLPLP